MTMRTNHRFTALAVSVAALAMLAGPVASAQAAPADDATLAAQSPDYYHSDGRAQLAETLPAGAVNYSPLDALGRSGRVDAAVTYATMERGKAGDRSAMAGIRPSGWPSRNPKVTIGMGPKSYRGYLYNRSHLLAKSLGGENSVRNMVTGTRTQNVGRNQPAGGMAYTETQARDWLEKHRDGSIQYDVTPNYTGSERIPRTVTVDMRSSDNLLDEHVVVSNTAHGYAIDYDTGASSPSRTGATQTDGGFVAKLKDWLSGLHF